MKPSHGAAVLFRGVVRELESGALISGIDYTCYPELAERQLEEIIAQGRARFEQHDGSMVHRLGFVAAGEAAVIVEVKAPHSAGAFELCQWYLCRIKEDLPIWKHPIFLDSAS